MSATTPTPPAPRRIPALGPSTPEGKAISSMNAITHGLLSRKPLLDDESPAEFSAHVDGLTSTLKPIGALEEFLVERIVFASWRLRRLVAIEAEALERNRRLLGKTRVGRGLGEAFAIGGADPPVWPLLARYESALARQFRSDLRELQRTQLARACTPASASDDVQPQPQTSGLGLHSLATHVGDTGAGL